VIRETTAPLRRTRLAMKRTLAQREDCASCSAKREKTVKAAGPVLKRYGLSGTTIEAPAGLVFEDQPGAQVRRRPL
jgi:hypothetical protein